MADDVDIATEIAAEHLARGIATALAIPVPAGAPGICESCGDDWPRVVDGLCAPCRDAFVGRNRRVWS